ncbi:MAG: methionine--tRNA ligase, partial [Candidatus Heimdallarchaeota archaeon]|nr:methionine--tRNA ligase [Candidatus Heimdallarchaeota archaeon]
MNNSSERYIVTSALPYVNGVKHLGNLIGSLLPADTYTRFLKLIGKDVIYICGTDDHGTPAELSALEAGKSVSEYVAEMFELQKGIYERFGLDFDYFGQTSARENHEITKEIFLALDKNGYINERTTQQLYSVKDKRFLPDRYVLGTCPHCGYENARGDQCENCTKLLDPIELINPRSAISGNTELENRDVTHLFIDLPKLQPEVAKWIETQTHWPNTSLSIAKKWLKEGLRERGITRNLEWGIEVPLEKYKDLVFYVWFDAPIGYISISKKWATEIKGKPELFEKYWKSSDTKLIQFMGIDNVPFHSVTFPCSIIGSDLGYQLVHTLKGFQWLTFEKGKFSSSQKHGIFMDTALDLYPADYWRYYLLLIAPERQDTDFQWGGFQSAVNSDLNNQLGNL